MSLTLTPLSPSPTIFHNHHFSNPIFFPKTPKIFTCFTSKNPKKIPKKLTDSQLSSEFTSQVHKINTQLQETQNALLKTKQMLFTDFCKFLCMNSDQVKITWVKLNPDEKLGLVKGFVSNWGSDFHPLSYKSVRELIDEYLMNDLVVGEIKNLDSSSGFDQFLGFSGFKKLIMGGSDSDSGASSTDC